MNETPLGEWIKHNWVNESNTPVWMNPTQLGEWIKHTCVNESNTPVQMNQTHLREWIKHTFVNESNTTYEIRGWTNETHLCKWSDMHTCACLKLILVAIEPKHLIVKHILFQDVFMTLTTYQGLWFLARFFTFLYPRGFNLWKILLINLSGHFM